jgi:holin-like protein
MSAHAIAIGLERRIHHHLLLQAGLVISFWLAGDRFVKLTGLPVPGGVVGMLILLSLLATRRMSAFSLRRGADLFIGNMVLFFVPAVPALLDHRELVGLLGLKILVVILGGTLAVMAVTGLIVDLSCQRGSRNAAADTSMD